MTRTTWIKWPDFGDDGEPNGCWCIGTGGNNVAVAVTVSGTEQEADLLTAAPELLAALEGITKFLDDQRLDREGQELVTNAFKAIDKAKGGRA